jgi:hypothetical protein
MRYDEVDRSSRAATADMGNHRHPSAVVRSSILSAGYPRCDETNTALRPGNLGKAKSSKGGDPIVSRPEHGFEIGKAIGMRKSAEHAPVVLMTTGVMTTNALKAADLLQVDGVDVSVVHFTPSSRWKRPPSSIMRDPRVWWSRSKRELRSAGLAAPSPMFWSMNSDQRCRS